MSNSKTAYSGYYLSGLSACLLALAFVAPAASAQSKSIYPQHVENQCSDDYFRHCSPYALGSDELRQCMEVNGKLLSRKCQQALKDAGLVRQSILKKFE